MCYKKNQLEVRQRGGTLQSKWTKYFCVLGKKSMAYYDSEVDYKKKALPRYSIPLETVSEVHNIKSQNGVTGFTFEIKSGETKTQHFCVTGEERQAWLVTIMKAKQNPEDLEEVTSDDSSTSVDEPTEKGETDYSNQDGTMVFRNTNKTVPKVEEPPEGNFANDSGTMVFMKKAKKETVEEIKPGYLASDLFKTESKIKKQEDHYESLSIEELEEASKKLEKQYKQDCEKLISAWKDEKSTVLDNMRKREVEIIENNYQKLQLELEQERQERREKLIDKS